MPRLIISSGGAGAPERTVDLAAETVSIGRVPGNTVVLEGEGKASRKHCEVVPLPGGGYEVVDLKSTNGTRVNGVAAERRRLKHGDVIEVGLTSLRYDDPNAPAAPASSGGGPVPDVCYLEWTSGDRKGQRVALSSPRTTFGRRDTNTVVLQDKMASGHHAEIVRDLNGFTVRDLGSMNGTIVNGEPVTETMLTHGARVRIGNAKFVFKDPSMADVEVALEGLEEDDGGWGMMADLDLSKAKGGSGGVLLAVVLILGLAGAAFVAGNRPSTAKTVETDSTNLVAGADFDASDQVPWTVDEGSPATAERSATGRPGAGAALLVRHDGKGTGPGFARYADDFEITASGAYRASAWMKREGSARAELAMQWLKRGSHKSGATPVTQTVSVGTPAKAGAWSQVSRVVRRPAWADAGRLVVVVGPGATARLDDVRFEPVASAPPSGGRLDAAGEAEAYLASGGSVDLARTATVLCVGATPFARMPDGRVLSGTSQFVADDVGVPTADGAEVKGRLVDDQGAVPASIRWTKSPEGLVAKVTVEGAQAVGLCADFVAAHLEDGIAVIGSFGSRRLAAQPGAPLDGVRKALLGDPDRREDANRPRTLVAFDFPGDDVGGTLSTLEASDPGLLRVALSKAGSTAEIRLMTSFDGEQQRARKALQAALAKLDESTSDGLAMLADVAREFPFQADVRKQALDRAAEREKVARDEIAGLSDAVTRFSTFGDEASLLDAEKRAGTLSREFPEGADAKSPLAMNVKDLVLGVRTARAKFDLARAAPEVKRLTRLGQLLEQEPGRELVAAAYYDAVVRRFGALEQTAAGAGGDEVLQQIKLSRERRDALLAKPEVRAAFPNLPD